jgi:hypothetical protein
MVKVFIAIKKSSPLFGIWIRRGERKSDASDLQSIQIPDSIFSVL